MARRTIGIIVHGATGRIGSTQHLANALIPIIEEGGLALADERLLPRLLLVGRNADRLAAVARTHKLADWTTDLDAALADPAYTIFFDAAATQQRAAVLEKAIAAGKHVYCEKPVAPTATEARALLRQAQARGRKHGVVEDKLHLPGLQKLAALTGGGELGRILSFRLEFGWWVFDGSEQRCQRPSWNYRADGGGILLDMYPHWRYVIERLIGRIAGVASSAWTATPERVDERGQRYRVTVEDSAATLVEVEGGIFGTIASSWATRVRRDDLLTLQVDGTKGSAVAGLHRCYVQSADARRWRRLPQRMGASTAAILLSQSISRGVGGVPAPCRSRCAAGVRLCGRHSRHRVCRSLPSQHAGAAVGGNGGDGGGVASKH